MTEQTLITFSTLLLAFGVLVLLFAGLLQYNKYLIKNNRHPVMQKFINQALIMAYKASEQMTDTLSKRLHSLEKKKISEYVYDNMLPDIINVGPFPVKWKVIVPKEKFVEFCSTQLDALVERFHEVQHSILHDMSTDIPL